MTSTSSEFLSCFRPPESVSFPLQQLYNLFCTPIGIGQDKKMRKIVYFMILMIMDEEDSEEEENNATTNH